ncbi:MAG TPA: DUF1230 domain-containing protein [Cyanothece sp. UBA12306]|nr:DUF1230 domain-containing protein [Cyanothece sp. UBA12306]
MRELPTNICPVPTEQQPVNEYEQLKESWFFRWATLEKIPYLRKMTVIGLIGWLISSPIAAYSFPPKKCLLLFILSSNIGAALMVTLVLLQLVLGWRYVSDRLKQENVFYEESGWYDGQTWPKPPEVLVRDRLIVSYQINPILQRLIKTGAILGGLIVSDTLVLLFLA